VIAPRREFPRWTAARLRALRSFRLSTGAELILRVGTRPGTINGQTARWLVEQGFIRPVPWSMIRFELTDAGREALEHEEHPF